MHPPVIPSESLIRLFAELRCASQADLFALLAPGGTQRSWRYRLTQWRKQGLVDLVTAPPFGRARAVWHATSSLRASLPLAKRYLTAHETTTPTFETAASGWLRGRLRVSLRDAGYQVSCGYDGFRALARYVLSSKLDETKTRALKKLVASRMPQRRVGDRRSVLKVRVRCKRCGQFFDGEQPHAVDARADGSADGQECDAVWLTRPYLSYDVAWRDGEPPVVVIVDKPACSIERRLKQLPIGVPGQRSLRVLFRSYDASSWSSAKRRFQTRGPRRRRWDALVERGAGAFPYDQYLQRADDVSEVHYVTVD